LAQYPCGPWLALFLAIRHGQALLAICLIKSGERASAREAEWPRRFDPSRYPAPPPASA
jgi:hypothetical protein